MPNLESQLTRWQAAGVIDPAAAARIRAFEAVFQSNQKKPTGLRWQGIVALTLGAILLACGVVLFVNAHWDQLGPLARFILVLGMVSVFHLGGAISRTSFRGLSTTLHAVGTISTGAAIALVGQIFNIQEHWPAAILLWAIAAFAGWALLGDEAQQTLTVLLFPAWLIGEWLYSNEFNGDRNLYLGRILVTWGALYLTVFLRSPRKIVQGICFAVAAIASLVGTFLLLEPWRSGRAYSAFPSNGRMIWGWIIIAAIPFLLALLRRRESLIPVLSGIVFTLALPWCDSFVHVLNADLTYAGYQPNLAAHALVAAYSLFLSWWGLRMLSRALVNLGIVGFAISVMWFYFSDIFDKIGRSLGLICLGILFLAGGWALEKTRRRLIAHMQKTSTSDSTAPEAI
jgi:uncharacterized membrane protein